MRPGVPGHGRRLTSDISTDLATLRSKHSISLKGSTLAHLIQLATRLDLTARPLRLDLELLGKLRSCRRFFTGI